MVDVETYKQKLLIRMEELDARLHHIEDELDEPVNRDFEERATEREGDEVLESLGNAGIHEFHQIQAALKRIKDGDYGVCVACGEAISSARLDTVPHAAKCRNCA